MKSRTVFLGLGILVFAAASCGGSSGGGEGVTTDGGPDAASSSSGTATGHGSTSGTGGSTGSTGSSSTSGSTGSTASTGSSSSGGVSSSGSYGSTSSGSSGAPDGGSYACGPYNCDIATQFCFEAGGGAQRPDASNFAYECKAIPSQCEPNPTCACLIAADAGTGSCPCNVEPGGAILAACLYP
jgi:hypothetical protein